jgi:hypothetical protein
MGALSLAFLLCGSPGPGPGVSSSEAVASMSFASDRDHDLLCDSFEKYLGTSFMDPDTDGDGVPDGFEFLLRSNPLDRTSRVSLKPGMRLGAYVSGTNLKITLYIVPAEVTQLEAFSCFLLSSGPGRHVPIDISSMIPGGVTETGVASYCGVIASSFSISLPLDLVSHMAPVSIGMAARISGQAYADVVHVDMVDGIPLVARSLGIPPELDPSVDDQNLPWDPLTDDVPGNWGDQQICVSSQTEVGTDQGITTWEVTSAGCDSAVNRACPPNCSSRVGQTVSTIDYSFLIASVSSGF